MSKISEIDKNLAVSDTVSENGLIFRNSLSAPFSLYGLLPVTPFLRFPLETAKKVTPVLRGFAAIPPAEDCALKQIQSALFCVCAMMKFHLCRICRSRAAPALTRT